MALALSGAFALAAQAPPPPVEFEVASIRPSPPPQPGQAPIRLHIDGAQVRCAFLSLKDYIGMAYRLKPYQVSGPDWISSERFDITAKLPEGPKRDQVPDMLQALLVSRFHVKSHRETRDFQVYTLTAAKNGVKLKEVETDPAAPAAAAVDISATGSRAGFQLAMGGGSSFAFTEGKFEARKMEMARFVDVLGRFMDRPLVDMTELKGRYDFDLQVAPEDYRAMLIRSALSAGVTLPPQALQALEAGSDASLRTALQSLGLKIETRKAPLEVLVVDAVDRKPTEN